MSYFPDFRHETDKLNELDKAFINGYRVAAGDAKNFFDNLDVYDVTDEEEKLLTNGEDSVKDCMEDWLARREIETVLSLFEGNEYDDLELEDANEPLYKNTKGTESNA